MSKISIGGSTFVGTVGPTYLRGGGAFRNPWEEALPPQIVQHPISVADFQSDVVGHLREIGRRDSLTSPMSRGFLREGDMPVAALRLVHADPVFFADYHDIIRHEWNAWLTSALQHVGASDVG